MDIGATTLILLVICVSCLLLFLNRKGQKNRGHLPPGPRPLPLLGNLLQLDTKDIARSLLTLSECYGPVFTIHLGSQPWVVLCGYQVMKEALVDQAEEFSARGDLPAVFHFTQGNGIIFSNGEKWKVLRRFALQTLRNFGMGKRSLEERIQEEARCLVQELAQTQAAPFDPTFLISRAVANVICTIVFGDRFNYEDRNFLTLVGLIHQILQLLSSAWGQENQDPLSYFHMETLVMTAHNLFFAGTETVSTTLRYGFLILMKYPEIQAKVQAEIDRVIGQHRSPSVEDRAHMPYTDAVIHEVQRFADIAPMGVPHAVTRDTQFRGFLLTKGTNVMPLLFSVHKDPTQFKDPAMFNPAHFLDERGDFRKHEAFMPFSAGKRICLGEGLARMELFLFFTAILQHFTLTPLTHPEEIDLSPLFSGFETLPHPYEFCAVPR
ncbi:cytochrome P450 2F3-like isoform X2 [Emydura macquarii macquarii]|uniref:cytochrome P450 2F3-like isoform X2 n=1 Tax=Emydura macquarii macquarii TaxID=1129001 RepID=UPI00352A49FC